MKKCLSLLVAATMTLAVLHSARAQTFTILHNFATADGEQPFAGVILSSNTLYGTTYDGASNYGSIFRLNVDGSGFTNLHSFTNGMDGSYPEGQLVLVGNTLYGMANSGGTNSGGTIFAINTDGTGFKVLREFQGYPNDCANPVGGMIASGNTLYGIATQGGPLGGGVFSIQTDGTLYTNLYLFQRGAYAGSVYTNQFGSQPYGELVLAGDTLYGTTLDAGPQGGGSVFSVKTNGTGMAVLAGFPPAGPYVGSYASSTGTAGDLPQAGLLLAGGTLYGTTGEGTTNAAGAVFSVGTNGSGFTTLYTFTNGADGASPEGPLILIGGNLYGETQSGHQSGIHGTVFAVATNGSTFTIVTNFLSAGGYAAYYAGLTQSGGYLYGTTAYGGSNGGGIVFSLFISPPIGISRVGGNVVLTWTTNLTSGFSLQSTTNLNPPVNWTPASPLPTIVNGQFAVTNAINYSITGMFYRLEEP